jgi:hypothetical protein
MAELITAETVRSALREQRRGAVRDIIDSRVPGLTLRIKTIECRWSVRARLHSRQRRWDLGAVVAGDDDLDGKICLATARARAMTVREMCRKNQNPDAIVARFGGTRAQADAEASPPPPVTSPTTWTWAQAKEAFFAELERSNRKDTLRDYRGKLRVPEFQERFDGRPVAAITPNEVARAYADIHGRGVEPMADGCLRVIKAFWSYLRDPIRADKSGVTSTIHDIRTLPRTRREDGDPNAEFNPDDEICDAPPEIELGRVLVISRSGALPARIGYGLQLLLASAQRRRAVVGATRTRFKRYAEIPDEEAWYVPSYWRKTRSKAGSRSHLVPIVGFGATAVRELDQLADFEGARGWLFPGQRGTSDRHAEVNMLNDVLEVLPQVDWSPHGVRYALTTYGERDLGFAKSESKLILDHMEGVEPDDVTGRFYSSDSGIARKRAMMTAWVDWLEHWATKALAESPLLADKDWLAQQIFLNRYGEERLARRLERRASAGLPLWRK